MPNTEQATQMRSGDGFVAALDQSGGSTPKALGLYGIDESAYSSDAEMFDLMHAMRSRMLGSEVESQRLDLGFGHQALPPSPSASAFSSPGSCCSIPSQGLSKSKLRNSWTSLTGS